MDSARMAPDSGGDDRHSDPVMDAALDWYARLQEGGAAGCSATVRAAFEAWRRADPAHAAAYEQIAAIDAMPELTAATRAAQVADRPVRGMPPVNRRQSGCRRGRAGWLPLAAAAAVALLAAVHLSLSGGPPWGADLSTGVGERLAARLPDGSRVVLNTDTALALDFSGQRRQVRLLRGEVYFDVQRDPDHPFHVRAGHGSVEVTGTAFAVRRDDDDGDTVILERGAVVVRDLDRPEHAVALTAGEGVRVAADGLSAVRPGDPGAALAWRDGWLVFHDQPLAQVIDTLRRYHGAPIVVLDRQAVQIRVGGSYRAEAPLDVLRALGEITGVRITILPGGVAVVG